MRIINDELLKSGRSPGRCELCRKHCRERCYHHVIARGMGGAKRLDIPLNLLCLGMFPYCTCHTLIDCKEGYQRCLAILSKREKASTDAIERAIWFILRLPRDPSPEQIEERILADELARDVAELVTKTLRKAGKL